MSGERLRVAITRDEAADGALSEALRRRGVVPVRCPVVTHAPALDPAPLLHAARTLESYDWLVVASGSAVSLLVQARDGRPFPPSLRTAAVGLRTAAALVAHGAGAPLTAKAAGATPLVEALRAVEGWPGRRVLIPRAADGGHDLADGLRGMGASVDEVIAYRTVPREPAEIAAAWRAASADRVVVASPSAARALVAAIGAEPLRRIEPVLAIGSTTAMALVALGVRAVVPPRAEFEAIAELLERTRRANDAEATE